MKLALQFASRLNTFNKMKPTEIKSTRLSPGDPSSYSRPDQVKVERMHLDWTVDFTKKIISGFVKLWIDRIDPTIDYLILDSRDLDISEVVDAETKQTLKYTLSPSHPSFGAEFKITLPSVEKKKCILKVNYKTSSLSSALQWLTAEQTAGKVHPYLFSQCQAIHCRSLVPCQDTPSVKMSYTADVRSPSHLVVLMSAIRKGHEEKDEVTTFKFDQPVPIPSYLLAIAVGALGCRRVGPRSHVWSEKELIEKVAYEFAETEKMLETAESLCGPYIWDQYDLLILPPSFPYGGMENPCLTFVTPTLLAGDRSLADVVVHEICHSWTGNLVTNTQWEHFWLNEGFTVFLERKIIGRMYGEPTRHFSAIGGWRQMAECIRTRGEKDPSTCLIPDLSGVDPDDSYSSVPYEKGHAFLWYLETLLGGPSEFEPFLKAYLEKFKQQSIDSDTFRDFLREFFKDKASELDAVDWKSWWHTPGMPPTKPQFDESVAAVCSLLCKRWIDWDPSTHCPFNTTDLKHLSSKQIYEWLSEILENEQFPIAKAKKIDQLYNMTSYNNAEIRFRWLRLCIRSQWEAKVDEALKFVSEQGRMKFVRPIYRDLYKWEAMRGKALANYEANKNSMMYVAANVVAKDLNISQ